MKVTPGMLSKCAEKIASYGFTDKVEGHTVQVLVARSAEQMRLDAFLIKRLTEELEIATGKK